MQFYTDYLVKRGEKKYRIDQVHQAMYRDFVDSYEDITTLSQSLREEMQRNIPFAPLTCIKEKVSNDGTIKVLFATSDGHKVETVLMRHMSERNTVCVSSQVGCAVNCSFCATGKLGLTRNLTSDEIVYQVLFMAKKLSKEYNDRVNNVVFMGMGEPFHNYDNVLESIRVLNDAKKLGIGIRHITVSTSGVVPMINRFADEGLQVNLAISLHAPDNDTRSSLMPINTLYTLDALMSTLDDYTKKTKRRIFYEYIMLHEKNDTKVHANTLGKLLSGRLAHVNLIPFNPIGLEGLNASSRNRMHTFQEILMEYGVPSTIRVTLGQDIDGACGQLAAKT